MTIARKHTVIEGQAKVYHCVSRCVRQAFLCGYDTYSKKNFDHRKEWVRQRLQFLTSVFSIEVLGYSLMSTHQHSMVRTNPELQESWDDEEVVRRWLILYPKQIQKSGEPEEPSPAAILTLALNKPRVEELRARLGSVSWFMKSLNEFIARKANKEDSCKGRFWEGRFKCQRVEGSAALLACSIYVDLNPIRAGVCATPEESEFTSAYERIKALAGGKEEHELWIAPIQGTDSKKGFLDISLTEYLSLLDASGRECKKGKRGRIPPHLKPILERLGVKPSGWQEVLQKVGRGFSCIVGDQSTLENSAHCLGKNWLKGISLSKRVFA